MHVLRSFYGARTVPFGHIVDSIVTVRTPQKLGSTCIEHLQDQHSAHALPDFRLQIKAQEDIRRRIDDAQSALHELGVRCLHDELDACGERLLQLRSFLEYRVSSPLIAVYTTEIGLRIEFNIHPCCERWRHQQKAVKDAGHKEVRRTLAQFTVRLDVLQY